MDEVVAYRQTAGDVVGLYYPHYNHLYSVAALTDTSGAVVERYSYNAYGTQTKTVMPGKTATGFGRGFTGYIADNESGLLHARARQYSPTLGVFIGRNSYLQSIGFVFGQADPRIASISLGYRGQMQQGGYFVDGMGLYAAAFAMRTGLDPSGNPYSINDGTNTFITSPEFVAIEPTPFPHLFFKMEQNPDDHWGADVEITLAVKPGYCCCDEIYWRQYAKYSANWAFRSDRATSWFLDGEDEHSGRERYEVQKPPYSTMVNGSSGLAYRMSDNPGLGGKVFSRVSLKMELVAQAICKKNGSEYILVQVYYGGIWTSPGPLFSPINPKVTWYGCDQPSRDASIFGHDIALRP